jgi:hypothetical protein
MRAKLYMVKKCEKYIGLQKMSYGYVLDVDPIDIPDHGVAISMIQRAQKTQSDVCIKILYDIQKLLEE